MCLGCIACRGLSTGVCSLRRYDGIVQKLKWNVSARELRKLPSLKKPHYEENGASWDSCTID